MKHKKKKKKQKPPPHTPETRAKPKGRVIIRQKLSRTKTRVMRHESADWVKAGNLPGRGIRTDGQKKKNEKNTS